MTRHFALFWSVAAGAGAVLVADALMLPGSALDRPNVLGIRLIVATAGALLCAAAAAGAGPALTSWSGGSPGRSGTR